jgi:N-glycosylase/DNA lyase
MKMTEIAAHEFDLAMTLDSGQVFHWDKAGNGFVGAIEERAVYVEQRGDVLKVRRGETPQPARETRALPEIIRNYFALDHPLPEICASFPDDPVMNAAREFCRGLRVIRQPKWECLATFICSSMKQVAHIRQISRKLRERFGEARKISLQRSIQNTQGGSAAPRAMLIDSASPTFVDMELATGRVRPFGGQGTARSTNNCIAYTFPTVKRIAQSSERELRRCALGYRAKNLLATARLVASGEADLEAWATLCDIELRTRLCELPGVGAKVANCVMLFAYERLRAFPIDVWIERVLKEKYFARTRKLNASRLRTFTQEYFGEHGGYAQQYLFHHARWYGSQEQQEIPRPRKISGLGMTKGGTHK